MSYRIDILPPASDEIYEAAIDFSEKFIGGEDDFLTAVEDSIERINEMPGRGKRKHDTDKHVRGVRVEANSQSFAYGKKFPYFLIYKVYETEKKVIIFQLWPERSNIEIREAPEE